MGSISMTYSWLFEMARICRDRYRGARLWFPEDETQFKELKRKKELESLRRETKP